MLQVKRDVYTCDADIASLQVRHDLLGAAVHGVQDCVRDGQLAVPTSRALTVEVGQDIG